MKRLIRRQRLGSPDWTETEIETASDGLVTTIDLDRSMTARSH
jgi:hypothetical protein